MSPQVSGSSHTPAHVSLHCDQLRRCQGRCDGVERFQSARLLSDGVTTGSARNTEKEPRCQSREEVSYASNLKAVWCERYILTDPQIVETKTKDKFWPPLSSFVKFILEYFCQKTLK